MTQRTKWMGKRRPRKAPQLPEGFVRTQRGPKVRKPRLYFKDAKAPKGWPKRKRYGKWYIYHHKKEFSTGCGWDEKAQANVEYARFCRDVDVGREVRKAPGQITFKDMIAIHLGFLNRNANTGGKLVRLADDRAQSVWWLRFFGKKKLIQYRKSHSNEFQTWYVEERAAYYLAHPEDRRSAANGAIALLRGLKRFTEDYAEKHETGWYPDIHIPEGEKIAPGPFFRRSQQLALLLACRGWVWDRKAGAWKTRTYVDENGVTRTTRRIRSRFVISTRKGKGRAILLGVRTGAREQDLMSVVWGLAPHTACVDVDDDGAGVFHRRGTEEADTNKSRPSSLVHNRLKCLLRVWKKADGQTKRDPSEEGGGRKKHRYLIRKADGRPYSRLSLASVVRDAGLPANYTEHALRRTAVEEAHLQCWSLPTAVHFIGMTADVLLKFYTDWNERAARSEAQALREANAPGGATALRAVMHTLPEDGDRVRLYEREVARLRALRQKTETAAAGSDVAAADSPQATEAEIQAEAKASLAALNAANTPVAAHRLRHDDLDRPADSGEAGQAPTAERVLADAEPA